MSVDATMRRLARDPFDHSARARRISRSWWEWRQITLKFSGSVTQQAAEPTVRRRAQVLCPSGVLAITGGWRAPGERPTAGSPERICFMHLPSSRPIWSLTVSAATGSTRGRIWEAFLLATPGILEAIASAGLDPFGHDLAAEVEASTYDRISPIPRAIRILLDGVFENFSLEREVVPGSTKGETE